MRILVVGFGKLARSLVDQIKRFPEYDSNGAVSIYHIFTRRNSLSYGSDLVVEIPDPHGDGYRTYNDGLQAVEKYSTTVSNYKPWLLEEAGNGSFHIVVDCTNKTQESYELISEILSSATSTLTLIPANNIGVAATINKLRTMLDGGKAWEPVEFTQDVLVEASDLWDSAKKKMLEYHQINRKRDISQRGNPDGATSTAGYSIFSAIPEFDRDLLDRFIVKPEKSDSYKKIEYLDKEHDCLIVEQELLTSFFGWHHTEQLAAKEFLDPSLEIESARFIKYLSNSSTHVDPPDSEYVIEFVHNGTMAVTSTDGSSTIPLCGGTEQSSFSYRPTINPPSKIDVHAGLETIIFTYRKMTNAD